MNCDTTALRWINARFRQAKTTDEHNSRIIHNVGDLVVLPSQDGGKSPGVIIINTADAGRIAISDQRPPQQLSLPTTDQAGATPKEDDA